MLNCSFNPPTFISFHTIGPFIFIFILTKAKQYIQIDRIHQIQ